VKDDDALFSSWCKDASNLVKESGGCNLFLLVPSPQGHDLPLHQLVGIGARLLTNVINKN